MSATTHRTLLMLSMIPRSPLKTTTTELQHRLSQQGYNVDIRTIQRDLKALASVFKLISDNNRPAGWAFMADANIYDIPRMAPCSALTLKIMEEYSDYLLPHSALSFLDKSFKNAAETLSRSEPEGLADWPDKVRILLDNNKMSTPEPEPHVLKALYEALFAGRLISIAYTSGRKNKPRAVIASPLGLVFKERLGYLIYAPDESQAIKQLQIHQIQTVKLHTARFPVIDFNLDDYIQSGAFGTPPATRQKLKLRVIFPQKTLKYLKEHPLGENQQLKKLKNNRVLLKVTVDDSRELRQYLARFAGQIEIRKPKHLRDSLTMKTTPG